MGGTGRDLGWVGVHRPSHLFFFLPWERVSREDADEANPGQGSLVHFLHRAFNPVLWLHVSAANIPVALGASWSLFNTPMISLWLMRQSPALESCWGVQGLGTS